MKLIGNKDKGYQLVSSFAPKETKPRGGKKSETEPEGTTATTKRKDDE